MTDDQRFDRGPQGPQIPEIKLPQIDGGKIKLIGGAILILVLAFSLGLAGVLTTVGFLFVKGRRFIARTSITRTLGHYVPAGSAVIITVIGLVITGNAIAQILS